jgi:hypothetical protein
LERLEGVERSVPGAMEHGHVDAGNLNVEDVVLGV